jgi:hypothetical protein
LNEEYNVGSPHAKCDSYDSPILVPNGDSGGVYEFRKDCHRRKRTFEVRSKARSKRGLGKLRPREKGEKTSLELHPQRLGCDGVHTNWEPMVILGTWSIRGRAEGREE